MVDIAPEAYFDCLAIAGDAPVSTLPMSIVEMHLYSYLGCILALFRGAPIADWGYVYAVTSEGFPFSAEFEAARKFLAGTGFIASDDAGLMAPDRPHVAAELTMLESLNSSWASRRTFLRAATECALALPIGSIRYAINQTSGIATSLALGQRRKLLDADDVDLLYDEYKVVQSVLGSDSQNILSPAVLWLSARVMRVGEAADAI